MRVINNDYFFILKIITSFVKLLPKKNKFILVLAILTIIDFIEDCKTDSCILIIVWAGNCTL